MAKTRMTTPKQSSSTSTAGTAFTEGRQRPIDTSDAALVRREQIEHRGIVGQAEDLAIHRTGTCQINEQE